jgi:hypothetical protein
MDLAKTTREVAALTSELEAGSTVLMREEAEWFRTRGERACSRSGLPRPMRGCEAGAGQGSAGEGPRGENRRGRGRTERRGRGARELAARALGRPLLARYDRLRSGTQRGPVVVPLHGNACGNCYTAVPMSRRSHIRAGLLLDGCEACGVILSATEAVEAT